ncbi:hypothetical protein E5288_WYG002514 [Bos mutus]|uniref:TGF-beta family profile domain-containing protein n=1 Tax=Bos mutus TaxID=72004 RepID=A0A6B0R4T4_9CETA|nr:hypothetical protein [Bos mutus]
MWSGEGALGLESPQGPFSQRNSVDMALLPMHPPTDPSALLHPLADRALLQGAPDAVELRELTPWAGRSPGACEAAARVYDLGLRRLRQRRRVRRERVRAQPCCRPTAYEDEVSFLDTHSRYHTVHELSARECACV